MTYVDDRGLFRDPPAEEFLRTFKQTTCPKLEAFDPARIAPGEAGDYDEGFDPGNGSGAA